MSALGQKRTLTNVSDVRFTPESGHCAVVLECPLSANSGHRGSLYDLISRTQARLPIMIRHVRAIRERQPDLRP